MTAAALQRPGGFAWWYLDLVDDNGYGLVLIWAWGLPFLPGLARDARRGQPSLPRERPAISFALYEGGRCTCYLLQEAPAAAASSTASAATASAVSSCVDLFFFEEIRGRSEL